jgi:hypothetical protein
MNATAIGVPELTCQLLDAADGIPADVAAAGLIISHGHFLHRDSFRRTITAGTSISTGQPLAFISWDAALHALEGGAAALRLFRASHLADRRQPRRPRHPRPSARRPGQSRHPHHHTGRHRDHHRQRLSFAASRGGQARYSAAALTCWPSIDLPAAPGPSPAC